MLFDAQCRIYPSLPTFDLDFYHIPKLCSIKSMSDEKKKDYICFRYSCKHGFVPSASFFIGSSESDRPWEEIYLGSLTGFFLHFVPFNYSWPCYADRSEQGAEDCVV